LKEFSNEQLLMELMSRGFVTGLMPSVYDVDTALKELKEETDVEITLTYDEKILILDNFNLEEIGEKYIDDLKEWIVEHKNGVGNYFKNK